MKKQQNKVSLYETGLVCIIVGNTDVHTSVEMTRCLFLVQAVHQGLTRGTVQQCAYFVLPTDSKTEEIKQQQKKLQCMITYVFVNMKSVGLESFKKKQTPEHNRNYFNICLATL